MRKRLKICLLGLAGLVLFSVGLAVGYLVLPPAPVGKAHPIAPTIFLAGSSGNAHTMDRMVDAMVSDPVTHAKTGLTMVVDESGELTVTGKISKHNVKPTIKVGMTPGTNNSLKYEKALKLVMTYLAKHYDVEYVNIMGFSAGGGGTFRYLIQYSFDRSLPPVKKFVALDGQFNACTAQPHQTLEQVLKYGPEIKTKYYKFWQENYRILQKCPILW